MLKSSKQFLLSNETQNDYGFKVKTSGVDLSQFYRNPIILWMHKRPVGGKNDVLPLGHWTDISVRDNAIYGTPVFDENDTFAMTIYNKVESNVIRMASAGLRPVQWDEGGKVLSKSIMEECSLVDIGSNGDALAVTLYTERGNTINLSSLMLKDVYTMNLAVKSWDELDRSGQLVELKARDYDTFATKFHEQFGHYPVGSNTVQLQQRGGHSPRVLKLFSMSYHELDRSGEMRELKETAPDLYREKYYQNFGKYPTI
ncbi:hypothetical protein [Sphingobacterium sp.]|uniref:hypothetical protein n=1 Tax=Sphingobacterium sp. TaxID=341027 RepID=UPI00289C7CA2|nr:hypothetical protein [Sphingobacterium sp.]